MAPSEKDTALAAAPPTAEAALALAMSGGMETGFEETDSTDFVMPLLVLLQKGSPQVDPAKPQYNEKARPGQFMDMTTGEILTEVKVIPCLYKSQMVEWKPDRQGFVASHDPGLEAGLPRNEKGQWIMPSGNVLVDTRYFYCLRMLDDGSVTPVIISLSSTQIKKAKAWMSDMLAQTTVNKAKQRVPYPIYLWICKITSAVETKGQNTWFGWKIVRERMINEKEAAILVKAQEARTTFQVSASRMKPPAPDTADDTPEGGNKENQHLG